MNGNLSEGALFTHIREFIQQLKMEYNAEFQVAFYTPIGRIVCDLEPPADSGSLIAYTDDPTNFALDISAMFDGKGVFDTQLTYARNVVVYKNDSNEVLFHEEQMILFANQILGFTLIKKQNNP